MMTLHALRKQPGVRKVFVKDADKPVLVDLEKAGLLFDAPKFEHEYPHCWRCDTPLIYYARDTWFIKMSAVKDRLVKNKFRRWSTACTCPPEFPVCVCGGKAKAKLITRKPIEANSQELEENRRSRSAHLRVLEKC